MALVKVHIRNFFITDAEYNEKKKTLDVFISSGKKISKYRYSNVSKQTVTRFENAESKGKYFAKFKKRFTAKKLGSVGF